MRGIKWILRSILLLCLAIIVALGLLRWIAHQREVADRDTSLPPEGRLIETAMGAIYLREEGPEDGPSVLLIHGSVGWSHFWGETLTALGSAGYRAIAFDMPPMGYSDRDPLSQYDRETQGRRVAELVAALEKKPILVAHSFGAGAGAEAVMLNQSAFSGFVVVAGAIGLDSPSDLPLPLNSIILREVGVAATVGNPWAMGPLLSLFLHKKDRALPEYVDVLNQPMDLKGTTGAIASWLPTLFETSRATTSIHPEAWRRLELPVAFIWGREDTTTPLEQGQTLAGLAPNAPLTVLDGLGHIPHIEDPAAFNAALIATLKALRSE